MHYWPDGMHMIWMTTWWIVVLGIVVSVIWFLSRAASVRDRSPESAEEILRRRYAAGEIDTEEHARRLAELAKTKRAA